MGLQPQGLTLQAGEAGFLCRRLIFAISEAPRPRENHRSLCLLEGDRSLCLLEGEAEGSQERVLSSVGAQDGGSRLAVEGTGELCGQGGGRGHAASMGKAQEDVPSLWHSGPLPKAASISAPQTLSFHSPFLWRLCSSRL